MKILRVTIFIFLTSFQQLLGQQYPIYNDDKPEIIAVWHRVADHAPVLRSVESARLSPDGRLVVSASKFGYNLMVWRVDDGVLLWNKKITSEIECVVFAPDGKIFATGDAVAFTPDGQYLVSGGHQRKISFYRLKDFQLAYELPCPRTEYLDFSMDGRLMLSAHEDDTQHKQELYHKIENQPLDNRDLKKVIPE